MFLKILTASAFAIGLATSALAQSGTSGTGGSDTGSGAVTGTNGTGSNAPGNNNIDPNVTSGTNQGENPNGMTDRCKTAAGTDQNTNTASGMAASDMQNCNK
jgi:hypothetical protein